MVAKNAMDLNQLWFGYPTWKVVWAGLLHDIGKIGHVDFETGDHHPRYIKDERWETVMSLGSATLDHDLGFAYANLSGKLVYPFRYNKGADGQPGDFPFADMSVDNVAQAVHVCPETPPDVLQAIQFADGHYVPVNNRYEHKLHPLAYLIHWSDWHTGCTIEKGWLLSEQEHRRLHR